MNYEEISEIIKTAIRNYYAEENKFGDKIGVSEAIRCLRMSYFYRTNEKVLREAEDYIVALYGSAIHEKLASILTKYGRSDIKWEFEVKLEDDLLSGKADAIMTINDAKYVLEFKTASEPIKKPFSTHILQVNAYLVMLSRASNADMGYLIYIPRKNAPIRTYTIRKDIGSYELVRYRAEILRDSLIRNEPPPAEFTDNCWFCIWNELCSKIEKEVKYGKQSVSQGALFRKYD